MSEEQKHSVIQESVLENIKKHRISMRSRKYFFLQTALFVVGLVIVFAALLYLASFIAFGLMESGVWFVPFFGMRGWFVFFRSLPWILILLTLIFALILEIMVRRYSFSYRRPLLYSMLGIVAIVLIGGFLVSRARFHQQIWQYGRAHQVPMVGGFYRRFGAPNMREVHKGVIREVAPFQFLIEGPEGETSTVIFTARTRVFPFRENGFSASDTVVIFGDREGRVIQAFGIKNIGQ
ncbi:MAG: hypothetical protein AAB903_02440 [Patescibacteria group bacterium]